MEKRGKRVKGEEGGKANAWASSLLFCPSHSCLCFGASLEIWGWWVSRVPEVRCLDGELGLVQVLEGDSVLQDQGFLPSCYSPNARRPGSREVCPCLSCNHLLHTKTSPSMVRDHKITLYHTGMCLHEGTNCFVANSKLTLKNIWNPDSFIHNSSKSKFVTLGWRLCVGSFLNLAQVGQPQALAFACLKPFSRTPLRTATTTFCKELLLLGAAEQWELLQ